VGLLVKRWSLVAALPLLLGGCMFPQGWHWPRLGSNTTETIVYVQNDVVSYQGDDLAWATGYYNGHPELAIRLVDTCPAGVNCIVARTVDLAYPTVGLTGISIGADRHLLNSLMRLDPVVGAAGMTEFNTRLVFFHELCHAFGGGFGEDIHELCNWPYRAMIFDEIARVYHDDSG
jgi:hypothetical protein